MGSLEKYLKKLGLSSYTELNDEEKETFRSWEVALSGRKLTDDDVTAFLDTELETAISRVTDEGLKEDIRNFRSAEVKIIKAIQGFINSPMVEKAMTERTIENLIKS